MTQYANWSYPTNIRFGVGRISELSDACIQAGIRKPLLVTDRDLSSHKITHQALDIMEEGGMGRAEFGDVDPNPNERNLAEGVRAFIDGGHDGVIAFGGGSGLDLGKMIAFMVGQSRPIWEFEDVGDYWLRADAKVIKPIVAVPTTAGTGSEVGRASVITNTVTNVKKIIFHPKVLPTTVIVDPQLTISMPPFITAGTGLDAFAHCVEAFASPNYHPMSQGIALEGMRLVIENLPIVYDDGANLRARAHMMSAAMMGATAFQKGLGAIHAMSHPIGALFNTHHGTTNAVCMPAVLALNAPQISDKFDLAAKYLGIDGGFDGFCDFVQNFNDQFSIPRTLKELGVDPQRLDDLIDMALKDPSCGGNPVKLNKRNMRSLFESCF